MTTADLRAAGEALYGPRWQRRLAREIAMNERTVRRYARGDLPIPERVALLVRMMLREATQNRTTAAT